MSFFVRPPLEHEGEQGLLDLAPERALGGQEEVLEELLGDGAAALDVAVRADVADAPRAAIRKGSSPGWLKKRRSSIASTALIRCSGSSS